MSEMTLHKYTGLLIAPTFKYEDGRVPTAEDKHFAVYRALEALGHCDLSLKTLSEALDAGADVLLLDVSINGECVCKVRLVP